MLSTDPQGFLLDEDGDLDLDAFFAGTHATGLDGVAQGIRGRICLVRGEWFRNLDAGIPWFEGDTVLAAQALLGERFSATYARSLFSAAILSTPGVLTLTELSVTFDGASRRMTVSWRVTTDFGDLAGNTGL